MVIEKKEPIKNGTKTFVKLDNKKFIRFHKLISTSSGKETIEWRRAKTNHLVKADQKKFLEEKFELVSNLVDIKGKKLPASGATMFFDFKSGEPAVNFFKEKINVSLPVEEQDALRRANTFFNSNSQRKQFIAEMKKYLKDTNSTLQTVKLMKDRTEWGLYETKKFFDNFINK